MSSIKVSSDEYRKSACQLLNSIDDTNSTIDELENGFKCLGLMYFGLDLENEFGENKTLLDIKQNESAIILNLVSEKLLKYKLENNHPIT